MTGTGRTWRRPPWLGGVLAAVALVACSSSDADGGTSVGAAAPGDTRAEAVPEGDEAVAVVEAYIEALGDGDVEVAIGLRCRAARPVGPDIDGFATNLAALEDELGSLDGVEARAIESDPARFPDLDDPVTVEYRVVFAGEPRGELYAATAIDEGKRRVCLGGLNPPDDPPSDPLEPVTSIDAVDLDALMPAAGRRGEILQEDRTLTAADIPDPSDGLVTLRDRVWTSPGQMSGTRVTADRFASSDQAVEAARGRIRTFLIDASEIFTVPDVPGAVGFRVGSWSWLWVQPPGEGPQIDYVTTVYGATRVEIGMTEVGANHSAIEVLTQDVHTRATGAAGSG